MSKVGHLTQRFTINTKNEKEKDKLWAETSTKDKPNSVLEFQAFENKVQIILPKNNKETDRKILTGTSPFLMALNQKKLNPMQSMKAFR